MIRWLPLDSKSALNHSAHERSGSQHSGTVTQILPRHRVGAAPARISCDGLPVREIDDRQQDDNAGREENRLVQSGFGFL